MESFKWTKVDSQIVISLLLLSLGLSLVINYGKSLEKEPEEFVISVECSYICRDNPKDFLPIESEKEDIEVFIVRVIDSLDFKYPSIIKAQAKLETDFTRTSLKANKNPFGMRHPGKKGRLSKRAKNGFAEYKTYLSAIADRKIYDKLYLSAKTEQEYIDKLVNLYFGDDPQADAEYYRQQLLIIKKNYE